MTKSPDGFDLRTVIAVPVRPGPLVPLDHAERARDEVDDLLDEMFGAPDDGGPSPFDLVLLAGGVAALIAGLMASATWLVVCGVLAAALGSVLPLRSAWRRLERRRRSGRLQALVGDGALLRTDHPAIAQLVDVHARLLELSRGMTPDVRTGVGGVAHAALWEVATLLELRHPVDEAELDYVTARTTALGELAGALSEPGVGTGDAVRRRAVLDARQEVERIDGRSSVTDAGEMLRHLRQVDGG